jgi:peptidoglycan/xylan/chitin deacetylase (PgdA/CDA1 family)
MKRTTDSRRAKTVSEKGDKNSPDLTEFQQVHQRRQDYRLYQEYLNKHRPRVFKVMILLLAITLGVASLMIILARTNVVSESSIKASSFVLPTPVAIDNLQGQKLVALTFDDGPDPNTGALLDILKKEKVTATFFVLGMRVAKYGDTTRRAYQEGHQIASHTYNHKNLTKLSPPARRSEINGTIAAIERTIGAKPTVMRPPYGAWNGGVLTDAGMPLVLWSIDTEDWKDRNADRIYAHVMANVRDGSIILFHDTYATSVEAVAKLIPALKAEGYAIVTVNRLIMARDGSFAPGNYYRHLYP